MLETASALARTFAYVLALFALIGVGSVGWGAEAASNSAEDPTERFDRDAYERQRRDAHARLAASGEDTMYASTPAPPDAFPLHLPGPHRLLAPGERPQRKLAYATATESADVSSTGFDEDDATMHMVAFFPSAADAVREGFVRAINHGSRPGTVEVHAVDDSGRRFGPLSLAIGGRETVHFNSSDLETGNDAKGLSGGTGTGSGDWRLELASDLDIEVLAYVRTVDGFLTTMHDTVAADEAGHRVTFFNPASNDDQVSRLRVVNAGDAAAEVAITGLDDRGFPGRGVVRFSVSPGAARTVTARELETGEGVDGALGDGAGKWRLVVESTGDIRVVNLLDSPTGHVTNLSTAPNLRDAEGTWTVPLFPAVADPSRRQGFLRVISRDDADGTVAIDAFDDTNRDYEPIELTLAAGETAHFNSDDLEHGNPAKGLSGGVGAGEGVWRLALSSDLDIEVLAYVRTADGFLTAMHNSVPARREAAPGAGLQPGEQPRPGVPAARGQRLGRSRGGNGYGHRRRGTLAGRGGAVRGCGGLGASDHGAGTRDRRGARRRTRRRCRQVAVGRDRRPASGRHESAREPDRTPDEPIDGGLAAPSPVCRGGVRRRDLGGRRAG